MTGGGATKVAINCRAQKDEFGIRVARVPALDAGAEGPCLCQDKKIIERDLGYIDIINFADPADPSKPDRDRLERFIDDQMKHYPFFLKDRSCSHQVEYRLLWITSSLAGEFVDIKVPDAVPFCSRPNSLTE